MLIGLTQGLPIGTNKALLHFLWMLLSGALLAHRGALFPALQSLGLAPAAVRRAWRAFRKGVWHIRLLLELWRSTVTDSPDWQPHHYEGYRPVAIDITAFWRPRLQQCPSQHYHPVAGRALPAVILGIVADVGEVAGQRFALPRSFLRVAAAEPGEARLQADLLQQVGRSLAADELAVLDAGFKISQLQAAGLERYLVRLPKNFTGRRNIVAPYKGHGRYPRYGEKVRPLPRRYKEHDIAASVPDATLQWEEDGRCMRAEIWYDLVLPDVVPDPQAATFHVYAIYDPRFAEPWLLATPVQLEARSVYGIYADRWPVEQIPLSAKHMVGAHRQFVFAPESIHRLPELALLAGSLLSFLAATAPVTPTGFWDRQPRPTPGRFRRSLQGQPFPETYPLPARIREKASVTAHLPKGIHAHRRQSSSVRAANST